MHLRFLRHSYALPKNFFVFVAYASAITFFIAITYFALYGVEQAKAASTIPIPIPTYLTSGTSWPVPGNWNSSNNVVEVIGGGAGGGTRVGGGGGAYARITNLSLGGSVTYQVGGGGGAGLVGGDTFFNRTSGIATTCTAGQMSVCAKGGSAGSGNNGGAGGAASASIGAVKFDGGAGGNSNTPQSGGAGGGGAAGPGGAGKKGGNSNSQLVQQGKSQVTIHGGNAGGGGAGGGASTEGENASGAGPTGVTAGGHGPLGTGGGAAGNNPGTNGGGGGGANNNPGGAGGAGTDFWEGTHGAGGGGGASRTNTAGSGGLYGGGGGGTSGGTAGMGAPGIIRVTYYISGPLEVSVSTPVNNGNACLVGTSGGFTITRNGDLTYSSPVQVQLSYGGAAAGVDYEDNLPASVTIPANQVSVFVPVTPKAKYSGSNPTLTATVVPSGDYNIGTASANLIINNNAAASTADVPGYTPAPFATYGLPIDSGCFGPSCPSKNGPWNITSYPQPIRSAYTPSAVSSTWYSDTPSPLTCYTTAQGNCLYLGDNKGTRIAALTAKPRLAGSNPIATSSAGVDIVSTASANLCGAPVTQWYYEAPAASLKVPKYTPIDVTYACQPNQSYLWGSRQWFNFPCINCDANSVQQRIFRFADRAKTNGVLAASLKTAETKTVSANQTLTLQCGGYRPEMGTQIGLRPQLAAYGYGATDTDDFNDDQGANTTFAYSRADALPKTVGLPPFYDLGSQRNTGGTVDYWPWTWVFYNAADPTYYHAPATLNVEVCTADNEVVVGNQCIPCSAPTPYRSGNTCIAALPPTATIDAGAGYDSQGNGIKVSVAPTVTSLPIVARYTTGNLGSTAIVATGGDQTTGGGYTRHTFASSGMFNVIEGGQMEYLVVGGGGGGGRPASGGAGGGGGAGGFLTGTTNISLSQAITVGAEGLGATSAGAAGGDGGESRIGSLVVAVGGGGGQGVSGTNGRNGGSGGGGHGGSAASSGGSGTAGQGFNGGNGNMSGTAGNRSGGGGGGASQVGAAGTNTTGGKGGDGQTSNISGVSTVYAAGGGGGRNNTSGAGTGGAGGGGNGGTTSAAGTNAIANTGSGGGGGGGGTNGGNGGSGIVIIRYAGEAGDPILATAINNDATNTSVDCNLVNGGSNPTNCWQVLDPIKTYAFNPSTAGPGTYTFSAQMTTNAYPNYNSYATVTVVVCATGEQSDGNGGCEEVDICEDIENVPNGPQITIPTDCLTPSPSPGICIPEGYIFNYSTQQCVPGLPPSGLILTATPARVRTGGSTNLTWIGSNLPVTCTLSASPSVQGLPTDVPSSETGSTGQGVPVGPINQTTLLTLTCTSAGGTGSGTRVVGTVPVFQEI